MGESEEYKFLRNIKQINMNLVEIYKKLKVNGFKWLIWRCHQELINPTFPIFKKIIDYILTVKIKISSLSKKKTNQLLYGIYDLEVSPITFNIVEFLCSLEIHAKKRNKIGFVVIFVPKKIKKIDYVSEYEKIIDEHSSNWRVDNILIQMLSLHPKCKGISLLPNRNEVKDIINNHDIYPELYDGLNLRTTDTLELYKLAKEPGVFDGLKATPQGLKYIKQYINEKNINKKIITIVIRQYGYDSARNSNLKEWALFVKYLITLNYHPIIVPDTDNAFNSDLPFDREYIFSDCCWNVQLRMALYEASHLNFSSPGGGGAIMLFNPRCRCIFMNMMPSGSIITTPEEVLRKSGYKMGQQWNFLTDDQVLCFLPDTFENIKTQFLALEKKTT